MYAFSFALKGPKREMFVAGIFTEIRPVWVSDLETTSKNKVVFNCFYLHDNRPRKTFLNFEFLLCLKMVFVQF